ncbi:hypothetical protein PHYSODRAFT_248460 [Phytophthora sojae]|uniref:Uncharacterized protein n=1 Tax=Phytophthora sojae (strain P6497) TaxID=1094619 RepID=G4YMC8_PHYSP|nr:hypothetical protein PHYSODRAFT_248460 [Phytophthora sojae]EGZ28258.1 hypothetical protein PHYSODRAFT_248460 [Phytophthora sojae]|eukprot:XP_009515533.1 hypothetical protein PHYSODRAFT_248460 [Phytophthora sojae]
MEAHRSTSKLPSQTSSGPESSPAGTQASGALAPQSVGASEPPSSPPCQHPPPPEQHTPYAPDQHASAASGQQLARTSDPQQEESASELHESPACTPSRTDRQRNQKYRPRVTSPHVAAHAASDVSSESEKPDESNDDEDWSTAEPAEEDREVTGDSEGIEDDEQAEEDISINLIEVDIHQKVAGLIRADKCERRCLQGKAQELQSLVSSKV